MKSEFPYAEKLKFKPLFRISGFVIPSAFVIRNS